MCNREMVSIIGIVVNIALAIVKLIMGFLFQSLAIMADGFNNLADALSMVVVWVCLKFTQQPADQKHPYGHQRMEYIASMVVGVSILFVCYELIKASIDKIMHPVMVEFSGVVVIVLLVTIGVKMWLCYFYKKCAIATNSMVLLASAEDSKSDVLSTSVILFSMLVGYFGELPIDGYIGIFVSFVILKSGIDILKDAMNKLLGEAPDEEFVNRIKQKILSYDGVLGIHDLIVHSYGAQRVFVCLHVEVDYRVDVLKSHELVDTIEKDLMQDENLHVVIHMDPIVLDNEEINVVYHQIKKGIKNLDEQISMHDFRAVVTKTHTNLVFDCEVPYTSKIAFQDIQNCVDAIVEKLPGEYFTMIQFERPYN